MSRPVQSVKLDELVSGKLPHRITEAIGQMDLSVEEVIELQESKPDIHITFTDGVIRIEVRKQYSLKKLLAVVGSVVGATWATMEFVLPFIY